LAAHAEHVGLKEIGFSDHSPMPQDDFDDWRMRASQLDQYVAAVERARREFPKLTIKLALEVDYLPGYEDWIRQLAARHPWDYFIGSVHYVSESWAIDSPHSLGQWKNRDPIEVWIAYFERLTMAVQSGLFDIVGHADLCKKFCYYPKEDCTPLFVGFLDVVRRKGIAIELNTSGLRKDCREIYPSARFLKMAAQRNIPITFGSDAHAPGEVGMDFAAALEQAREAGYRRWVRFTRRKREEVEL